MQVVQVCAEHKKPAKLAKHLQQIREAAKGLRNPPRVIIFANRCVWGVVEGGGGG
jgi:ATP-dependent RNA helicase DDX5/DBP2